MIEELKTAPVVTTRTNSGGFKTSDGTLYISKPFRSKKTDKLRATIKFKPRMSHFDTSNESSGVNEFRGFFSLFWISMFLFTVGTYIRSLETNGYVLNLHFFTMFSEDAITLALSDAVLVLSTGLCVPFAKAISKGWIKYYWTGLILQHLVQTFILFTAISWTFNRKWPWVQSGFLTLHSLVMIMKMHSYMTVNGYLQHTSEQAERTLHLLRKATDSFGGWDQAVRDAIAHRRELNYASGMSSTGNDSADSAEQTPSMTPSVSVDGSHKAYVDAPTAMDLRKRLIAASVKSELESENPPITAETNFPHSSEAAKGTMDPNVLNGPQVLVDHPNEDLSVLAKEYAELHSELTSAGPKFVTWPNNITWKDFAVYQLIPTLVYELEYPRTTSIRPLYVFEKTVATFGTFALLYTVTESFIIPLTPTPDQSFFRSLLDLALPFMMAYLLLFYIIFVSQTGNFMKTGWNSTTWDEFARKWNKPVHTFLLRHVYASTIASFKISRTMAMFLTFLLSAAAHELVMVVVTKKVRMYLFLMQLVQIPLIAVTRIPVIKRNKLLGNIVFWLGLYAGFPLLCVCYVAY